MHHVTLWRGRWKRGSGKRRSGMCFGGGVKGWVGVTWVGITGIICTKRKTDKKSYQQSPIVAGSLLRLTVTMVCCKPMVNFIVDFYFSTNIPHSCIQIGIAAYIFQILRHYHWSLSLTPAFSTPAFSTVPRFPLPRFQSLLYGILFFGCSSEEAINTLVLSLTKQTVPQGHTSENCNLQTAKVDYHVIS